MKKIIKRVLAAVGALVLLGVLSLAVKFYVLSPKSRPAPSVTANTSKETIERGRYLVENVTGCLGCHSPVQDVPGEPPVVGKVGAGRDFKDPTFPGRLRAPNISSDKEEGIGAWTDGEVLRAMREGVSRDGRPLFPQMPYTTYAKTLTDEDALAIIAYLRTVPPAKTAEGGGHTEVKFPVSMFIRAVPQPLTGSPPPAPPVTDKKARGEWLLQVASCHDCHDTYDSHRQPLPGKALGGGFAFTTPKGRFVAPNISSDPATGIGAYSEADLRRVFDEGKGKAGRPLYVMPWSYYSGMTKEDKEALIFALKQQPPVQNAVEPSVLK
ncbi:MAG: c-type cytochrome [Polyangiaceae bacterium]